MADYWVKSGTGGNDSGSSWANAAESIPGLMAAQALAGGDTIYVHNTHNYAAGAAITWQLPESGTGTLNVLCVDGGDPTGASLTNGVVGNLTTGAIENTNGNFQFTIASSTSAEARLFVHGLTLQVGSGSSQSSADFSISTGATGATVFSACTFYVNSTSASATLTIGQAASGHSYGQFRNCQFKFGTTTSGNCINYGGGIWEFRNCNCNVGSAPASLFLPISNVRGSVYCYGCDWSNATTLVNVAVLANVQLSFSNCVIATPTTGTHPESLNPQVECHACAAVDGTNGADILAYYFENGLGVVEDDQTVYLTTGSAQGTQDDGTATSYSLKMQPSSTVSKSFPLYTPWIWKKVASTGDKTITIKACDAGTDADELHTSEIWMEVEYMGEPGATGTQRVANSPMSIVEVDDDCPVATGTIYRDVTAAGADRTDTDEAWTGITETNTYTLTASINLAEQGYIRCRVGLAFDRDVYVDPKIGVA